MTGSRQQETGDQDAAEDRAIVRELARQLDVHDAQHTGAWGEPDEQGCIWCR